MSLARLHPINFSIIWTTQQFFRRPSLQSLPATPPKWDVGVSRVEIPLQKHKTDLNLITCLAYFVIFLSTVKRYANCFDLQYKKCFFFVATRWQIVDERWIYIFFSCGKWREVFPGILEVCVCVGVGVGVEGMYNCIFVPGERETLMSATETRWNVSLSKSSCQKQWPTQPWRFARRQGEAVGGWRIGPGHRYGEAAWRPDRKEEGSGSHIRISHVSLA